MFTAVVVLHDSEERLRRLLTSIDARLDARPHVVVVDSGSRDGGPGLARSWGAEVLVPGANVGFGAACNAGVAAARSDVTVLLNPDCELLDGSLARLAELAREHPEALHAPRLLNADGSVQRSAHPLPGTWGALAGAVVHPPLLPPPLRDRLEPYRAQSARTVGWVIAACMAARTDLLRRLGPFDPAVHLFGEDLELCLRARAVGVPTVLHPVLAVRHAGGHSTLRAGEPYELLARRRREAVDAMRGRRARQLDDLAQALTFASRAAGHALLGGDSARPSEQLAALRRVRRQAARRSPRRPGPALLVSYAGVLGGAEKVLLDWGGALNDPLLACPEGALAAAAREAGIGVVVLPERSLRFRGEALAAGRALAGLVGDVSGLVARHRPRVVVASGRRPVLACALARLRGVPLVAIHHDLPTGPVLERAVRLASMRCDAVVATSATVARTVGRAQVIHPGVDLAHWRPEPLPDEPRALVLGALVPWKRADLALEVAARVPGLLLELVGEPLPGDAPDFARALRDRAARPDLAGRVTFSGALADPRPALARSRLLLHCAAEEPYGLVLVEALATGRPVAAPDAGGPAEILAGGGGRLYRPGDAVSAVSAVRALLADPGDPRARAEAFDRSAAARRFVAVIDAVRLPAPPPAGTP